MNILFEIADKDLIIILSVTLAIFILGIIAFYIANKNVKIRSIFFEEEIEENPRIPLTKEQQEAKSELERVFNQMSADLDNKSPRQAEIDDFEKQQEENAIISYQELMRQTAEKEETIHNVVKQEPEEENKFETSINEEKPKENKFETSIDQMPKENTKIELSVDEGPKKFKNSEIISPIYGIQNEENFQNEQYRKPEKPVIKHTYNEVETNFTKENNRDFLNSLKEFRKNL